MSDYLFHNFFFFKKFKFNRVHEFLTVENFDDLKKMGEILIPVKSITDLILC